MNAVSFFPVTVEPIKARDSSISAFRAVAGSASEEEIQGKGKRNGLLSRMYPGLSLEQAAAVVRQEVIVEQLRKVARSR